MSEAEYDQTVAEIDALVDKDALTPDEEARLEALSLAIEREDVKRYGE